MKISLPRNISGKLAGMPIVRKLGKHAPAILTGIGIVGMIGGTVLACRATADATYILDELELMAQDAASQQDEKLREEHEAEGRRMIIKIAKSYVPAVIVDVVSIGCIVGGSEIAHKRLLTMTGIATSTAANFASYRNNVRESEGDEKDMLYLKGASEAEIEEERTTKKGKIKKATKKVTIPNPDVHPQYSFQFKRGDGTWSNNLDYNLYWLQNAEQTLNRKFRNQGYLFLNQVYDELGIKDTDGKWLMTQEGQVVGWFDDGTPDKHISFGLNYSDYNLAPWNWGCDDHIWIEPNCDGVIIDKI